MIQEIKIRVLRVDEHNNVRELWRNVISWDNSVEFPYQKIVDALQILYASKSPVVEFSIL